MIDSHHHIWRQQDLPWLLGPEQPRIFGPYEPIKRDYLISEYRQDIAASGITQSVYVQANWAPNWAADEAAWVQSAGDAHGWPHAIVAYADFTVSDVRPQLEKLAQYSRVRGIRQQLHWHENPQYRFAITPNIASDPNFQRNIAKLAEYNWCFDLQLFAHQAAHGVALARACPQVNFILQHAGMLEDRSPQGWSEWRQAMQAFAACDNLYVKLSGLGTFVHRLDVELTTDIVHETIEIFGAERCMWGSNFPIEKLWTRYTDLVAAMQQATDHCSDNEKQAIFSATAQQIYRL